MRLNGGFEQKYLTSKFLKEIMKNCVMKQN